MTRYDRRRVLQGMAAVGTGLALGGPAVARTARTQDAPAGADPFAAEVEAGLAYFQGLAAEHLALAQALAATLDSGDEAAAQAAYIAVRPPYEQIEVLAASFPETDEAIDARPYAIDGGETSPDYVSVHRIEALLFRDGDPAAALPFAEGYVESARRLAADLERRDAFTAQLHFEGMIALANEVASKKISSEEETWSDQSLLIFAYNWRGIHSQYEPFAAAVERADAAAATAVAESHRAALATLDAYPEGDGSRFPAFSSVPMAERGAIVRASYAYRDALTRAAEALAII